MIRVEIIANNSVQEDILDNLERIGMSSRYTMITGVHGRGRCAPKRGDHIWPEENFIMIIYCEKEEADKIDEALVKVKQKFPNEGVKAFRIG